MRILYNIGIRVFEAVVHLVAPFNSKASLWVKGRENWADKISGKIIPGDRTIWMHCASLGEFEQGRPVIEEIKKADPSVKVVLTFFSPSGYEIRKNYDQADYVAYLPSDTLVNAVRFIDLVNPVYVIFVKYEFWNNYISELYKRRIPLYLISGIFRHDQHFFRWYGSFFRAMLHKFEKIYVQDQKSVELLSGIGIDNVELAGDTRFDRVVKIAASAKDIPVLEQFRGEEKLFLAGSSWKPDEEIIAEYINAYPGKMKWVFAPHEIDKSNIDRLEKLIKVKSVRFSVFNESLKDSRVLIIDNIGMLSSAYRYACVAAIGGGFGKGIHNLLEPVCWGVPVVFGPNHDKFREAIDLKENGGAKSFAGYDDFRAAIDSWLDDENLYKTASAAALEYVRKNTGATEIIVAEIAQKDINNHRS
jgi:3-deoxy-D-manno-octulosonic-acid transferase